MTQQELCKAKDQDLIASVAAMKRAAALARQVTVQTGTRIVVNVNDTIVWRTALQLQAELTYTQRGTD
jgi:hypothetical protein